MRGGEEVLAGNCIATLHYPLGLADSRETSHRDLTDYCGMCPVRRPGEFTVGRCAL
jgi:hypothetical protein